MPVTVLSTILILVLIMSELMLYSEVNTKTELAVDVTRDQKMRINFNITFSRLSCHVASVDVMDVAGEHQTDIEQDIYKVPLDEHGEPIAIVRGTPEKRGGGAPGACSAEEAREA